MGAKCRARPRSIIRTGMSLVDSMRKIKSTGPVCTNGLMVPRSLALTKMASGQVGTAGVKGTKLGTFNIGKALLLVFRSTHLRLVRLPWKLQGRGRDHLQGRS